MTFRTFVLAGGVIVVAIIVFAGVGTQAQTQAFRTPWGDPDIQGIFTTDDELGVPFERPQQFAGRDVVSDKEFEERRAQARQQAEVDAEEVVAPRPGRGGDGTGPPAHWLERGKPSRRTSIIIDPPDGRIPYLNDEARKRAAGAVNQRTSGQRPYDSPASLDMYDRCITRGLPHVIFPTIYNNTSQIVQGPGFVAIRYEMIHDARVIPLDGRPQLSPTIRQYFGDSRGHWEGDSLVVETTNMNGKTWLNEYGDVITHAQRVRERFTPLDAKSVQYEATITDPLAYTAPWTVSFPLRRVQDEILEVACHEDNEDLQHLKDVRDAARRTQGDNK
jgi:hypothetical protein